MVFFVNGFFFTAMLSSDDVHDNRISISLDNKIGNGLLRQEYGMARRVSHICEAGFFN